MADQVLVDNGAETDYTVSTDDAGAAGHVQRVKLAYSADGVATHVAADADGLLVNLGTNNDVVISDGGNTITVDGTVAVTHAALTELAAAIDTEVQVDVVSSALPTGAATSAKQDTVIGHLDGVETLLGTIDADTGGVLTAVQLLDDAIVADDAAFTPATTKTNIAGFFADEASTDSVDEGDAGAARMTLDRRQIVVPQPHATGGCDTFHSNDLDETEEDVKTSPGTVYGWIITNRTTATVYIRFYNATAANVTVGTTAPLFTFAVPGNATDAIAANLLGGIGINFSTAISVAATTDFPDDGSPAGPAANLVLCTVFYT